MRANNALLFCAYHCRPDSLPTLAWPADDDRQKALAPLLGEWTEVVLSGMKPVKLKIDQANIEISADPSLFSDFKPAEAEALNKRCKTQTKGGLGVIEEAIREMRTKGWKIKSRSPKPLELQEKIRNRYPKLIQKHVEFLQLVASAETSDEKAWFLCENDYNERSEMAFEWNCWELMSVDAADGYPELLSQINKFWTNHIPILNSVKSEYAFLALDLTIRPGCVVHGFEPEFEETSVLFDSFESLLLAICRGGNPADENIQILNTLI